MRGGRGGDRDGLLPVVAVAGRPWHRSMYFDECGNRRHNWDVTWQLAGTFEYGAAGNRGDFRRPQSRFRYTGKHVSGGIFD